MIIKNGSGVRIAFSTTLEGAIPHKRNILASGQALEIPSFLPNLIVEFVSTPDGLRCAIREEGLLVPTYFDLN